MAQTSYPFDGVTVTEAQYSQLFREFSESGVAASADALSLKVSGDGGGMRVFVQAGFAVVRGFAYNSTATEQLSISAANTNPRIDRVVLRLDPSVNSVVLAVKTGTPATSPAVPSLTQTDTGIYELPLGQVYVGANVTSIAAGNVTDERVFNSQGTTTWSTSSRPASAREGKLGYNKTTKAWEYWSGAAWAPVVPEVPIGTIVMYGDTAAPTGWHLCDGSAHGSSALEAVIGSANTPDLRSRFIVGAGTGSGLSTYAKGATGGAESVTLTAAQSGLPAHSHTASSGNASVDHVHTVNPPATTSAGTSVDHTHSIDPPSTASGNASASHTHSVTAGSITVGNASADHSHSVDPPATGTTATSAAHTHDWGNYTSTDGSHNHSAQYMDNYLGGGMEHNPAGDTYYPTGQTAGNYGATEPAAGAHNHYVGGTTTVSDPAHGHTVDIAPFNSSGQSVTHTHSASMGALTVGNNSATHTHTVDIAAFNSLGQSATHTHSVDIPPFDSAGQSATHNHTVTVNSVTAAAASASHENRPPYYALTFIIKKA